MSLNTNILILAIAVLINCSWSFFRGRKKLLIGQALASFGFATYFYTLPEPALIGGHMNLIAGTQCLIAIPFEKYPRFRYLFLATIPLLIYLVIQGLSHYTGPAQTIGAIASATGLAIQCYGRFQMNPMTLRYLILLSIPFWIIHNILMQAYPALISDTLAIITISLGIKKARQTPNPNPPHPTPHT